MEFEDMKFAVVIAWAIIWSVIAVLLASSPGNWILLVGAGVLPPLAIARLWHPLAQPVPAIARR